MFLNPGPDLGSFGHHRSGDPPKVTAKFW